MIHLPKNCDVTFSLSKLKVWFYFRCQNTKVRCKSSITNALGRLKKLHVPCSILGPDHRGDHRARLPLHLLHQHGHRTILPPLEWLPRQHHLRLLRHQGRWWLPGCNLGKETNKIQDKSLQSLKTWYRTGVWQFLSSYSIVVKIDKGLC